MKLLTVAAMSMASMFCNCCEPIGDNGVGNVFESAVNRRCRLTRLSADVARDWECEFIKLPLKRFGVE